MNLNNKGFYNGENRQFSSDLFIAIFPNAISDDLCSSFVEWYNAISEQGLTMSSMEDMSVRRGTIRKDEVIHIPRGVPKMNFPDGMCQALWPNIWDCFTEYNNTYFIDRALTSDNFKAHRVQLSGGYHEWHHEHSHEFQDRMKDIHKTAGRNSQMFKGPRDRNMIYHNTDE